MSTKTLGVAVWDLGFFSFLKLFFIMSILNFSPFNLKVEVLYFYQIKKDFYDQILALNFGPKYAL